jgi:CubicO group peptidase (beta-lactamase class C family)
MIDGRALRTVFFSFRFAPYIAILFAGASFVQNQLSAQDLVLDSAKTESIRAAIQPYIDRRELSGAVALISHRGTIVFHEALGEANIEMHRAMEKDSLFAIASMTKPITATALMILVDENKVGLNDPVSKFIPEFRECRLNDKAPPREITIRDCLTHTSGVGGSQEVKVSLAESVAALAREPMHFAPGERWEYGPGISIAGRVVEVASGMPLSDFLDAKIFKPCGMTDTTFKTNEAQAARMATLYEPGEPSPSLKVAADWLASIAKDGAVNPSGGLISSASDLAKFYNMILSGGKVGETQIVSRDSVEQMTALQTGDLVTGFTDGNGWGLGWCVVREPQGVSSMLSPGTFGHGGALGTQGWIDPKTETVYVLLIQRNGFGNSDGSDLRRDFQQAAAHALGVARNGENK